MFEIRHETQESLLTPELQDVVDATRESWQSVSYDQVVAGTRGANIFDATDNSARAIILDPLTTDIDETRTIALALPHMQDWSEPHYMRARVMQLIVAPNSRVVIFPNNSKGCPNYNIGTMTGTERSKLSQGNLRPLAERNMRTLEKIDEFIPLGDIALTGYSLGARMVLKMATVGSTSFGLDGVNADETPSKLHRDAKQLEKDFRKSGGPIDLVKAVKESQIPALNSAKRADRLAADLTMFVLRSLTSQDAKLMQSAMTGDIESDLHALAVRRITPKIGFVEGSLLFDPSSLMPVNSYKKIDLVEYGGEGFHKHASGDNLILHALMANDGLNRTK
jgi:hypothetical protein